MTLSRRYFSYNQSDKSTHRYKFYYNKDMRNQQRNFEKLTQLADSMD